MLRPMHMKALVSLLLALAISGCADDSVSRVNSTPLTPGKQATVSVGETIDFSMYTHCGVEDAHFNGRVWKVVDPLYSSPEKHSPPEGWSNPSQPGRLTLESPQRAVFEAPGKRVVLVPSETGQTSRPCA
jgi:hypothetical protein